MEENKTKTELADKQTEKVSGGYCKNSDSGNTIDSPTPVNDVKCSYPIPLAGEKCTHSIFDYCNGCKYK